MGSSWTVDLWGKWHGPEYSDREVYAGESMWGAIYAVWKHRQWGVGCITVRWRPRSVTGEHRG